MSETNYLRVDQYMTTDLFTVQQDDAIEMVANLMIWERIRHVPVEDADHKLVGVITHRAVLRFLMSGGSVRRTPVAEIMKRDVVTVGPETATIDALRTMRKLRVGCLPVLHHDRLVGIVTEEDFMDIASKMLEDQLGPDDGAQGLISEADIAALPPIPKTPGHPDAPADPAPAPAPAAAPATPRKA